MSKQKTLEILVPQYKETDAIIKPLLDSIAIQHNAKFDEIGVIIVNDGTDVRLSKELLTSYPFDIKYILNEHKGVSGTRNKALDCAKAKYVMWCDADDMFYSVNAFDIIFKEINRNGGFKTLASVFMEEGFDADHPDQRSYGTRGDIQKVGAPDCVFVHGKVHNRKFLIKNNLR